MKKHYVIAVYGYKNCTVLGAMSGGTKAECERSIRWQVEGGGNRSTYHICQPVPDKRGTFASVDTGAHFETNRGAFTEAAYEQLLSEIWG